VEVIAIKRKPGHSPQLLCTVLLLASLPSFLPNKQWVSKVDILEPTVIRFGICWNKDDARFQELHRLTDNYNLQRYGLFTVLLENFADAEQYAVEIKKLAAANELPDVFLLSCVPANQSIWRSGRLMDLSSVSRDNFEWIVLPDDAYPYLMPIFQEPIVCYYHPSLMPTAIYDKPIFRFDEIMKLSSMFHERGIPAFAMAPLSNSGISCDLLFALFQSQDLDSASLSDLWKACLLVWREIVLSSHNSGLLAFNRAAALDYWHSGKAAMIIGDRSLYEQSAARDIMAIGLSSFAGIPIYGHPLCLAARNATDENDRENILDFVTYLCKNLGSTFLPYNTNLQVLVNRSLDSYELASLHSALDGYLGDASKLEALAEMLAALCLSKGIP
jgi:hypothetical protein